MLWYCEDGQIDQARKLLKRMRFERRLLHYCRKKAGSREGGGAGLKSSFSQPHIRLQAKRGFDSIVQEMLGST